MPRIPRSREKIEHDVAENLSLYQSFEAKNNVVLKEILSTLLDIRDAVMEGKVTNSDK